MRIALLADQMAHEAFEAAMYEEFAEAEIAVGRSIFGLFPAADESRTQYAVWRDRNGRITP